jgi:hypothetical protein
LIQGLAVVRGCFSAELEQEADLVIAEVRPPLDRDFYQADKGIKNTEFAVRAGGVLLVEAECARGVGIDHFVELLRAAPTAEEARAIVESRGYRLGDHKAVRLRTLTDERGVHVGLVGSNVPAELADVLGVQMLATRSEAVDWARGILGAGVGIAGVAGQSVGADAGAADDEIRRAVVVHDAGNIALEVR